MKNKKYKIRNDLPTNRYRTLLINHIPKCSINKRFLVADEGIIFPRDYRMLAMLRTDSMLVPLP